MTANEDATVATDMSDVPSPELAQAGTSLPTPEEIRAVVNPRPAGRSTKTCNTLICCAASMLIVIVLSLSLALGITREAGVGRLAEPPEERRNANYTEVRNFVIESGITKRSDLLDPASAQSVAVSWLAEVDPLNLELPESVDDPQYTTFLARYVLAVLYYSTGGTAWRYQFSFLTDRDVCAWNGVLLSLFGGFVSFGVFCNNQREVYSIYLDNQDMAGSLPTELGKLSKLQVIDFNYNDELSGSIPTELCELENLRTLAASFNLVTGNIPSCIGRLSNLRFLQLSNTLMGGPLPDLSPLTKLQRLFLDDNDFEGNAGTAFNDLVDLRFLFAEDNRFTGEITSTFLAGSNNLIQVDVSDNMLQGDVPVHLFNFPNLQLLDIHGNNLDGMFPQSWPSSESMLFLALHDNRLRGSLHSSITNFPNLFHLDVSNNELIGPMPAELSQLRNLTYLFLAQNDFTAGPIPIEYADLTKMEEFSVKSTNRVGALPNYISSWTDLKILDLDDNGFSSSIPESWGSLENLQFLLLNRNFLSDTVPSTFSNLRALRAVFLEENTISGGFETLCALPTFNEDEGDSDGTEILVADCGGTESLVNCTCCTLCCDPLAPDSEDCHDDDLIVNLNPQWEFVYDRVRFDFGNDTRFIDRDYLP